jgi:hypothetical protein
LILVTAVLATTGSYASSSAVPRAQSATHDEAVRHCYRAQEEQEPCAQFDTRHAVATRQVRSGCAPQARSSSLMVVIDTTVRQARPSSYYSKPLAVCASG